LSIVSKPELAEPELRRWMREYSGHLLAVVSSYASDAVEAEDLLQEAWLRAYAAAPLRKPESPVRAWLIVIALNVGRDHQRRVRRRARLRRLWALSARAMTEASEPEPLHPQSRLWRAVAELPSLQQRVLMLRVVEGLSTAETAAVLERAEGTVKASLWRALQHLRGEFAHIEGMNAEFVNPLPDIP
jgi:RNA polymerase sigma-70 factor (ECF subfamily)